MSQVQAQDAQTTYSQGLAHAEKIRTLCGEIEKETDLSPRNPNVNRILSSLVSYLSHIENCGECSYMPLDTLTQEAQKLPKLCGEAECMMEKFWAMHFIEKNIVTQETLREFWYYNNYKALWDLEKELIAKAAQGKTLVFLGSGAMPFTAFFAAWDGYNVICIDYDNEACTLSQDLIQKLGLEGKVQVIQHDATSYPYTTEHFVICASLIEGKENLYNALFERGAYSFAVRDAEGAYKFLYTPSPRPTLDTYTEVACTTPNEQCINTLRLFERSNFNK